MNNQAIASELLKMAERSVKGGRDAGETEEEWAQRENDRMFDDLHDEHGRLEERHERLRKDYDKLEKENEKLKKEISRMKKQR